MVLIHNAIGAGHNGVSQQPAVQRPIGTVEDMVNCIPTIESGTIKRNPISELVASNPLTFSKGVFAYEYDRGYSSSNASDRFSIQLNGSDHKIINLGNGELQTIKYSDEEPFLNDGVTANPQYIATASKRTDRSYLTSGIRQNFAGVTLKDTTFLTNKTIIPKVYPLAEDPVGELTENRDYVEIAFDLENIAVSKSAYSGTFVGYEPRAWFVFSTGALSIGGVTSTFSIKTTDITHTTSFTQNLSAVATMSEYFNTITSKIISELNDIYDISYSGDGIVRLTAKTSTETIAITDISVTLVGNSSIGAITVSDYITITEGVEVVNLVAQDQSYKEEGFIWFQKSDPTTPYSYTARVKVLEIATGIETALAPTTISNATTEGAATAMATALSGLGAVLNAGLIAVGSVTRITCVDGYELVEVNMSDTFGNLASHGWANTIDKLSNLPRSFPFSGAIVKITGEDTDDRNDYWVKRVGDVWQEWFDPFALRNINASTMPRTIKDNNDGSFTVAKYDGWEPMLVGDEITNPIPSFLSTSENPTPVIKDIFFHKNRLGFITDRSIVFSEIGRFGNFWKSTVAAALDKDRIDGYVDSQSSIKLEYATSLEDLLVLFAGSEQFLVASPDVLSSKSIQVSKISAYDVNTEVRPIFVNNSLFFCAIRGNYTQIMKYKLSELSGRTIIGTDITKQVPRYIPSGVNSFGYSAINEMIFVVTEEEVENIYVFKETTQDNQVLQSAWFKWSFQLDVLKAFSFNNDLYMLTLIPSGHVNHDDWVIDTGSWRDIGIWYDEDIWTDDPDAVLKDSKIHRLELFNNLDSDVVYLDNGVTPYTSLIEIGEWKMARGDVKEDRGHLLCKTIEVDSNDSEFQLFIRDIKRNSFRIVESKYTVDRKPMLYGNAENVRVSIINNNELGKGFKINNISLEGTFNIRSRRS